MAPIHAAAGEDTHHCQICGTKTEHAREELAGPGWETPRICPHCRQRYYLTDEAKDVPDLNDLGEIEIVDESSGTVVGMTWDDRATKSTAKLKARLERLRAEEKTPVTEASQADLDHLFGKKRPLEEPSPYGDEFGSY
ncbi:hypothetical protein [Duganella sp. FT27W]|uniref:hypothetical protein n=1 Tax=Duganella sp. FT27W TaxID=2654636 RepID=UPI00128E82F6|nr:hypothetical protein [Duganella sp. FT27W]MPQ56258.1 hypothetical protein [Duganella sp. FT27W]